MTASPWLARILAAALAWLFVSAAAFVWGMQPNPGLLALVVAAGACVLWLYLDVSVDSGPMRWEQQVDEPVVRRGEDPRLSLLLRVISGHLDSKVVMNHQLHRRLGEVADERLVAHHGLTLEADPRRAAAVLGPELSDYLQGPRNRRLTLAQIDALLARIEAL